MNLNPDIEVVIEKALNKARQDLLLDIQNLNETSLLSILIKIGDAQEKEFKDLFEVPGHLPKDFGGMFLQLFNNYETEDLPPSFAWNVSIVHSCIDFCRVLERDLNNCPVVFVRAKLSDSEHAVEQFQYRICRVNTTWKANRGFQTEEGLHFDISKIPVSTVVTTQIDRVPLTVDLLSKLVEDILNVDNWALEEVDPAEHYEQQMFQWRKAFDKYFERS